MSILSVFKRASAVPQQCIQISKRSVQFPEKGDHKFIPVPSNWTWYKFKDFCHFYLMIGMFPTVAIATYCNLMIGPATLSPMPEGYTPKEYEYQRHPITRFIARYAWSNYQESYEKTLHLNWVDYEHYQMRIVRARVEQVIDARRDVKGYKYKPHITKYHKAVREFAAKKEVETGGAWKFNEMDMTKAD